MSFRRVRKGDSVQKLAYQKGLLPDTVWSNPENQELRDLRGDKGVLFPGDRVFIPEKKVETVDAETDTKHRFVRKAVPSMFRMRFLYDGEPCDNDNYQIDIDGQLREGCTDDDGWLVEPISPDASRVKIIFEDATKYEFSVGNLDPIDEISGVQGRLRNLGYYSGAIDGQMKHKTIAAIETFQRANDLDPTGDLDALTVDCLTKVYGS